VKASFLPGARVKNASGETVGRLVNYDGQGFYLVRLFGKVELWVVHEDDLALDYPLSAKDRLPADDKAYQIQRLADFNACLAKDRWPEDSCKACQDGSQCCQTFGHHHLDFCTHCGNDERDPRVWKYRGRVPAAPRRTP